MLGDLIAEEKIKIIGRRVLSVDNGIPEIETFYCWYRKL